MFTPMIIQTAVLLLLLFTQVLSKKPSHRKHSIFKTHKHIINPMAMIWLLALPLTSQAKILESAQLLGPLAADKTLQFTMDLKLRHKDELIALSQAIYDEKSPHYHQYLTYKEYKDHFAPTQKTLNVIKDYLKDKTKFVQLKEDSIKVTATTAQVEQLFKTSMANYRYKGKSVYTHATKLQIPNTLAPYVLSVSGLDTFPRTHQHGKALSRKTKTPTNQHLQNLNDNVLTQLSWDSFKPKALPTANSLNGFTGEQLRRAYNMGTIPLVNGVPLDGAGQTIIILDEWGKNDIAAIMENINTFSTQNNLPLFTSPGNGPGPFFVVTHPDGRPYSSSETEDEPGWTLEIALDLASAHTIAPKANIVLVLNNDLNLKEIINTVTSSGDHSFAQLPNAYVLSNSWGQTEGTDDGHESMEQKLLQASVFGLSVNFSSSDCGDGTYNSSWPCSSNSGVVIEYPASSAYATAIGGTSLFVDNNFNYSFETGWGTYFPDSNDHFNSGSTGGISQEIITPSWQNNSTFQGFTAGGYGVIGNYGKRAVPDIAMLADLHTGIIAYYTHGCEFDPSNPTGSGCIFGGTSVACPLYSGTLTLINQARMLQNKPTIGFTAPYLYNLNTALSQQKALNFITPPHLSINGTLPNPLGAPYDAFTLLDDSNWVSSPTQVTFNWDSSLTMSENQYWNDIVGIGSPFLPNFIPFMSSL